MLTYTLRKILNYPLLKHYEHLKRIAFRCSTSNKAEILSTYL